jgi:predicted membrane protein
MGEYEDVVLLLEEIRDGMSLLVDSVHEGVSYMAFMNHVLIPLIAIVALLWVIYREFMNMRN